MSVSSVSEGNDCTVSLKTAIVHDWLPVLGGAERVVAAMAQTFPRAEIFTLFDFLSADERRFVAADALVHVSGLNRLPFVKAYYRNLLLPATRAIEEFDVTGFDLVISSSAALAKGVITAPGQSHFAYVHSPARYAWDLTHEYVATLGGIAGPIKRAIAREILHRFRIWDMRTVAGVDHFIASSRFVHDRIWTLYRREAEIIYPPVDTQNFRPANVPRQTYYFTASRMVPYKRMPMIVEAFNQRPDLKLIVAGDGPDMRHIQQLAQANVEILGHVPFEILRAHMQACRAFVFAAREDFGIVPIEAMACGAPVIALNAGGTSETIRDIALPDPTGILFKEQTPQGILDAVDQLERNLERFTPQACRAQAEKFSTTRFQDELTRFITRRMAEDAQRRREG